MAVYGVMQANLKNAMDALAGKIAAAAALTSVELTDPGRIPKASDFEHEVRLTTERINVLSAAMDGINTWIENNQPE